MPKTLTETATFTETIDVPEDGDPANATDDAGPLATLEEPFQVLADRTRYLVGQPDGLIIWTDTLWSEDPDEVGYGAIHSLRIEGLELAPLASGVIDMSAAAANSWYYIYASIDGTTDIEVVSSLDPPDSALLFCSTDDEARYLGCCRTDSAGDVLPFRKYGRRYLYTEGTQSPPMSAVLSVGAAAVLTEVVLGPAGATPAYLPPHARIVELDAYQAAGGTGDVANVSTAAHRNTQIYASSTKSFTMPCTEDQSIFYKVVGGGDLTLHVLGFTE